MTTFSFEALALRRPLEDWPFVGRLIEESLLALGWERCWTKSSAESSASELRRDLLRRRPLKSSQIHSNLLKSIEIYVFLL